jgi:hypothetical protein
MMKKCHRKKKRFRLLQNLRLTPVLRFF